jgi:hypothetical protein
MTSWLRSTPSAWLCRSRILAVTGATVTALVLALVLPITTSTSNPTASIEGGLLSADVASSTPIVRVSGNQLIDGSGQPIRLLGVNHSGSEYECIQGRGFFDPSDTDTPAAIDAMKTWNINTVRVTLNEDCWLGINMSAPQYGGANYRAAITQYVDDLNAAGLAVIVTLQWSAPGSQAATGQSDMADEDHSPAFWSSVASTFKDSPGVLFDLFSEPHDLTWPCIVNGCSSGGIQYAGYNQLISSVRSTGASNVVMVAGLDWASDLSGTFTGPGGYPADLPYDPAGQMAVSVHVYSNKYENSPTQWNQWLPIGTKVPLITGEFGEFDCGTSFVDSYMAWADANDVSYLGWTFNAGSGWTCAGGPSLITDDNGDPTPYGLALKNHLASIGDLAITGSSPAAAPPATSVAAVSGKAVSILPTATGHGYDEITSAGDVVPFGDAESYGSMAGVHLNQPIVAATLTPDGKGYWLVASDGGVFSFGDAAFYGSTGGLPLNRPIATMAATADGRGYWEIAADGGVFSYGDAAFHGSTGGMHLNEPIVGAASSADGLGYWLVASDGGIFSFGDARFLGSTGAIHLNQPVTAMARTPDGGGYWLIASDGGIFSFGDARFLGSTGAIHLNQPVTAMARTPDGGGYWLIASDGGIFSFGDARFEGSIPGLSV